MRVAARSDFGKYQEHLGMEGWVLRKEPAVKNLVWFVLELQEEWVLRADVLRRCQRTLKNERSKGDEVCAMSTEIRAIFCL